MARTLCKYWTRQFNWNPLIGDFDSLRLWEFYPGIFIEGLEIELRNVNSLRRSESNHFYFKYVRVTRKICIRIVYTFYFWPKGCLFQFYIRNMYKKYKKSYILKDQNSKNVHVVLAPSFCGENCFRVIRDLSDCISFPDERNESLLVILKNPFDHRTEIKTVIENMLSKICRTRRLVLPKSSDLKG